MFTLKELNLMKKVCDSFDSSFISKDEEKRVSGIRSKICNLITLQKAWDKGVGVTNCNDFCRCDADV